MSSSAARPRPGLAIGWTLPWGSASGEASPINRRLPGPNCYWGIRTNEYGGLTAATVRRGHPTLGALFHTESSERSPGGGTATIAQCVVQCAQLGGNRMLVFFSWVAFAWFVVGAGIIVWTLHQTT